MSRQCAIIGIGQTRHASKRDDVSMPGLVREAALRALDDAGMTFRDIDAVVLGKCPDTFEGVMMPELFLADALGAAGKPILRVHTAGSVGGSTAVVAAQLVAAHVHARVLAVTFEKQSESDAMWALSPRYPFQPPLLAGAGGYFAPLVRAYIRRAGAPEEVGARVAVKDRRHALRNPFAHLHLPDLTEDAVRASPMLWDPIRYLETCPSSDGACALVLADETAARRARHRPAWVHAAAVRTEPAGFAGRDTVNPRAGRDCAADVYRQAGLTDPLRQLDVAELYVPFSWFEPMWLENAGLAPLHQGWRLVLDGTTELGGALPVNPSGGVLSTNPVGAAGMLRFAEAALQVRGQAGAHQVDGARLALGHAFGGASQFFAMWIVGSERP
jgi:acetyl-CoA C-acetyltransferase